MFRLNKVKSNKPTLRNVQVVTDDDYFIEKSVLEKAKELVFGKSEETLKWEENLKEVQSKHVKKNHRERIVGNFIYDVENTNGWNYEYLMQVYCGSEGTEMSVTFDTGSDWLILQSADTCSSCDGDMFPELSSTSYASDDEAMSLSYGSASVDGVLATDDFYLDAAGLYGVEDFSFMLI